MTGQQVPHDRPMRIRPMLAGDIARVLQISAGLPHAPHWPIAAYQAALNANSEPHRIALVAETLQPDAPVPGTVVGFVVASRVAGEAELASIAGAAEAQRRGSGGQLLNHLIAAVRELWATRINLEVRASNYSALRFYKRHGFMETGKRVGYYADPVEDAVLLSLALGGQKMG